MAEKMLEMATAAHNTSASGSPSPLQLSPVSLAGIVVGSVLLALALMVVALGVLVVVLVKCKVQTAIRSGYMGSSALPNG